MRRSSLPVTVALVVSLTASLRAQGADNCANAQVISGLGNFAINNTNATLDGPADCNGNPTYRDVWYRWTAPSTGGFKVSLCGGVTFATRLVVYDGPNCGSLVPITCAAGNCTLQSYVLFSAVSGHQYLLRLGNRQNGAAGGNGTFAISSDPCPGYQDDAFEDDDTCSASALVGNGTYLGLLVRKIDPDWYEIPVPDTATMQIDVLFTHANGDIDIFLYQVCGGTAVAQSGSATDNEQIIYQNTTGCLQYYQLLVQHYAPDPNGECNLYDMIISGSGTTGPTCNIGTNFCSSFSNSTGQPAVMSASGTGSVASNNLVLEGGPTPNQPGLFFYSAGQANGGNGVPFGNGLRCVGSSGNPLFRLPVIVGSSNHHVFPVDYGSLPAGGDIIPGSTFHFQLWFRDPAGGGFFFDLSDGYTILFTA
jgi:hypothetical protein